MQHPGIVPIYDIGEAGDKRPYFTMKLIKGKTLSSMLKSRESEFEDHKSEIHDSLRTNHEARLLGIFEQICQTMAYAHSHHVIHRDLKPANIMVGNFGEVQVMDWGLAKVLKKDEESTQPTTTEEATAIRTVRSSDSATPTIRSKSDTLGGQVLGTPAYMPPEQACGKIDELDERCDVFGLGAILCVILTGKPPYEGESTSEIHNKAMQGALSEAFIRLDDCGTDTEMIGLAKLCLSVHKENRPRNAQEVAEAVTSYLESVQQRLKQAEIAKAQAETKTKEERKRRRVQLALAASLFLLIASCSAIGIWYQQVKAKQDTRRQLLNEKVVAALNQSEKLHKELHNHLRDPIKAHILISEIDEWKRLVKSARNSWRQARTLTETEPGLLETSTEKMLLKLGKQLDENEQNWALAKKLDEIRQDYWGAIPNVVISDFGERFVAETVVPGKNSPEFAAREYADVLKKYGIDLLSEDRVNATKRVAQSPIRYALLAALDHFADVTKNKKHLIRILQIARNADPDKNRHRLRELATREQVTKLLHLADNPHMYETSPALVVTLARLLSSAGHDPTPILQRALMRYPRDFLDPFLP